MGANVSFHEPAVNLAGFCKTNFRDQYILFKVLEADKVPRYKIMGRNQVKQMQLPATSNHK